MEYLEASIVIFKGENMDNNKHDLDSSNDISEENNSLDEVIDEANIKNNEEQYIKNEPLYTEVTNEIYENQNKYNYSKDTTAEDKRKDNTAHDLSIASMILGISSIISSLMCCCSIAAWVISIICAIVGIVLGAIAKDSKGKREGMAIAGIICSIVGIVISVILLILLSIGMYVDSMGYFN